LFPAASSQRIQNNKMIISYEMHYWKKNWNDANV